jgi:hypothetical protein
MNQRTNQDDLNWIPLSAVVIVAIAAYVVWQFATTFGLDMSTGAAVVGRLVALGLAVGISWKFGDDFPPFHLANIWPVHLGLFWVCWWPAIHFWAMKDYPAFYSPQDASVWWDAWYTRIAGLIFLVGGGYSVRTVFQNR